MADLKGGLWSKILSFTAGFGVASASEEVVKPVFEPTRQNAWARRPYKVLDPETAATAQVKGFDTEQIFTSLKEDGTVEQFSKWPKSDVNFADDAVREGIGSARWDVLRRAVTRVPPYPEVLKLWRRERVNEATVNAVLDFEGIPDGLRPALKELVGERADPEVMANAVQQSFVDDAGLLGDIVDGPPFNIPLESVPLDTLKEFKAAGFNKDRAKLLALLAGNPPAPDQLANMVLRDQISDQTFIHGLREGRTKTKWAKALLHYLTHPLLNPGTLVQRRLRGYDTADVFHTRMARYGYTAQQADDWFEASGRPLAPQQMLDLIARKGPSPTGGIFDFGDFRQGMVESDIKPKYSTPAEALYYKYPPLFQLRRAVESGGLSKDRAREIMHIERYEPQDIESLLSSWGAPAVSKGDPYVARAQTQLWGTLHRSYIAAESDETTARAGLGQLGITVEAQDLIVLFWNDERELIRKQLTAAQVKKAYSKAVRNEATGLPWTRDDALAALLSRGWAHADATTYLDTPSGP